MHVSCPLCGSLSPTIKLCISHLRLVHQNDENFSVQCIVSNCAKMFLTFPAFNTHMYRRHRDTLGLKSKYDYQQSSHQACLSHNELLVTNHTERYDTNTQVDCTDSRSPHDHITDDENRFKQAKFLLMLREEKHVSHVAIDCIVSHCRTLCEHAFTDAVSQMKSVLPNTGATDEDIAKLSDELDGQVPDFFSGIDTAYLLEEFAKKHMDYIVSFYTI